MDGDEFDKYMTRCLADEFRTSRSQNRVISKLNRFLNGGKLIKSEASDGGEITKIPVKTNQPVKRDADCKARRKRINRRLAKGKPVEKGVLRDPPKNLECRLAEGVKFENRAAMEIGIIGTAHELTVKFVPVDSEEAIEATDDALGIFDIYMAKTHGKFHRKHWEFSNKINSRKALNQWMLSSGTDEEPFKFELYHMHIRLDG